MSMKHFKRLPIVYTNKHIYIFVYESFNKKAEGNLKIKRKILFSTFYINVKKLLLLTNSKN